MIDITKTYKTRDGREVRIYATDCGGGRPVHGAINYDGEWSMSNWTAEGVSFSDHQHSSDDLIEVRPRIQREVWVNVYDHVCTAHNTKELADLRAETYPRLACVKIIIDCEEREGL
jgi:hypothetical protein